MCILGKSSVWATRFIARAVALASILENLKLKKQRCFGTKKDVMQYLKVF